MTKTKATLLLIVTASMATAIMALGQPESGVHAQVVPLAQDWPRLLDKLGTLGVLVMAVWYLQRKVEEAQIRTDKERGQSAESMREVAEALTQLRKAISDEAMELRDARRAIENNRATRP